MINDRDLYDSIGKARDLWLSTIDLSEGDKAPLSPEFEKKTLRLLKHYSFRKSLSRMFTACIIVALMMSAMLYTVIARPECQSSLSFSLKADGGCIVNLESDGKGPRRGNVGIEPGFLPEGYRLISHGRINNRFNFSYCYDYGSSFSFLRLDISVTDLSNYETQQNIEYFENKSVDAEMIKIRDCAGYYIANGAYKYIMWLEDNYFIQVHGYMAKEEIVKTAQNLIVYGSKK